MKIFLDDRSVELLDFNPGQSLPDELVIEYHSGKEIKKGYRLFEEEEHLRKLVFWSDKGDDKWKEDFFALFKRIEAAGGLVKNEKGEELFIFRLGKWDLPKGKLNGTETPEEAAIREVGEETGLTGLGISRALGSTYHIYTRKGKRILKRTGWFEMEADSTRLFVPQTAEDISEVRWVGKVGIGNVLANTYASIKELVSGE